MNLNRLGEALEDILDQHDIPHTAALHGLIVTEEAGEVARAVLKHAQGIRGSASYWMKNLEEELAGVVTAAAACAVHNGIDLEMALANHLADLPEIAANWRTERKPNGDQK